MGRGLLENCGVHLVQYNYQCGHSESAASRWRRGVVERGPFDIVFADPPYNIGKDYDGDRSGDDMPDELYRSFVARTLRRLAGVLRPGGTVWWMCPVSHLEWVSPMLRAVVGPQLHAVCWHEAFSNYNRSGLTHDWRVILAHTNSPRDVVFCADDIRVESVRQKMGDSRADPRGRIPGTVWSFRRLQGTSKDRVEWHPHQLPPELLTRIVRGWSERGGAVLDAFAGSGSMGMVCLEEARRFVGVDRSPVYVRQMRSRLRSRALEMQNA